MANGAVPSDAGSRSAYTRTGIAGNSASLFVYLVRPDNLFGRRHRSSEREATRRSACARLTLETRGGHRNDAAAAPDLLLLRRQRKRLGVFDCVRFSSRLVWGSNRNSSPSLASLTAWALHDMQPEVERIAAEETDANAADDDHVETSFSAIPFSPRGSSHARSQLRTGRRAHKRLRGARSRKVGHQITKRSSLPPFVERLQTFRNAISCRCNLVGIDGVEFPPVFHALAVDPRKSVPCRG